jgi:hypothetical protein
MQKTTRLFFCLFIVMLATSVGFAGQQDRKETSANTAASVKIVKSDLETELADQKAPAGKAYLVLETEWQNIHPKQKVKKSDAEGKPDRTMGVGGLMGGKTKEKEEDYMDMDVPYLIPNFFDHTYLLADGQTYSLDKLTEVIPEGYSLKESFSLPKLVFLLPAEAKNIAFQFFDYSNGHILVPIKGDQKLAAGAGAPAGRFLDQIKDNMVEIAAQAIHFQDEYKEEEAPEGWRFAVAELSGKSLSGSAKMGNIIQVEPGENIWLATKEGYLYYSCGGSTTEDGFIRFTPEFSQNQEVAFLVPSAIKNYALGIRLQNRVYTLKLDPKYQPETAQPLATHRDGKTMEVFFYGMRKEGDNIVLDLGIKSLAKSGLEIQSDQQFILKGGEEDVYPEETATQELPHRPPTPFVIPPLTFVRFELAFAFEGTPSSLYYRGYESEKYFELKTKD